MALSKDIPITREMVYGWLQEYVGQKKPTLKMRAYLTAKLKELELDSATVDTTSSDSLDDETSLVDMILLDLDSYVL